jgi:hypothetical protein
MTGNARVSIGSGPNPGAHPGQALLGQCTVHIGRRVFLVGCPRSGTTLLQSMLAAHSQIVSFPETHFFERVSPRFAAVGMASPRRRDRRRLLQFLSEVGHPEMESLIPRYAVTLRKSVGAFVEVLDALTLVESGTVWVEKTPGHLHHIDLIEAHIPDAHFIHLVRRGEDVVASLYEVSTEHPELWGAPATLENCIARWTGDLELTRRHIHKPQHTLVRYEQLLGKAQPVLTHLCEFIGVPFSQDMLSQHSSVVQKLVLESETWKDSAKVEGLRRPVVRKFDKVFDREQQAYIRDQMADHDIPEVRGVE